MQQNYLYNSGSELERGLDLGWYQTPFRAYDPAIGRFLQIDPLADFFSGNTPFNFAENNPVLFGDPSGLAPTLWQRFKALIGIGRLRGPKGNHAQQVYVKPVGRNTGDKKPYLFRLTDYSSKQKPRYHDQHQPQLVEPSLVSSKREDLSPIEKENLPPGRSIKITKSIEFVGGEDALVDKKKAAEELDPLIKLLLKNPEIRAFIQGNVGDGVAPNDQVQLNGGLVSVTSLMSARARAIYNSLRSRGVPAAQLSSGPGEIKSGGQCDLTITVTNGAKN